MKRGPAAAAARATEDIVGHENNNTNNGSRSRGNDDVVVDLLNRVGPRPAVPDERAQRVKDVVRGHWKHRVRTRARKKNWIYGSGLAAAAAALIAVTVALWPDGATPFGPVATLEAIKGPVSFEGGEGSGALRVGDTFSAGMSVETGASGRVAFRLATGPEVRVEQGTRLSVASDAVLALARGTVYIDSGSDGDDGISVEVRTSAGVVHDIGTQFEVHTDGDSLRVRVREGEVVVNAGDDSHHADSGEELVVDSSGNVTRTMISLYGSEWNWTQRIAPPFALEGRPLDEFLDWVSRESGRRVGFDDVETAGLAKSVILHGSIEGLTPEEALTAVLPTAGMTHHVDEGIFVVKAQTGPNMN